MGCLSHTIIHLAMTQLILQGVQNTAISQRRELKVDERISRVERLMPISSMSIGHSNQYPTLSAGTSSSSHASFHSALSALSATEPTTEPTTCLSRAPTVVEICGNIATTGTTCERFCRCLCHIATHFQTPTWACKFFGSLVLHGNGSIRLRRRACNLDSCNQSGSARIQALYAAPRWISFSGFVIYANAQIVNHLTPAFNLTLPRTIPYSAMAWSCIELGNISELKNLLSLRLTSPYDIAPDGSSLLKYAAIHGQNDIYDLLVKQNADPFMRSPSGTMAVRVYIFQLY
ncbi:hypothetical protein P280DRAFT_117218 [Massarina eburnea CBS 473.64]|uniref:Uncharacterized protein n=1 Tax=Massarina eburnea CBS 473.64 TaxID=1395130 RepID=A0A6A6SCN6_9PLEO|nr:hypothetical protein P280DRAFT_117218 [Massarina eburnea CBS 473.64]